MKDIRTIASAVSESPRRTAVYCRVSTTRNSQLNSFENQQQHFKQVIHESPALQTVGFYCDAGRSGTSAVGRPELQRLLEDCRRGKVDLILTKSISRFARNTTDCLELIRELRSLDVQVYFEKENLYTGNYEGDLMMSILASLAEEESRSISDNCKWAINRHFQNGDVKFSRAPFGYRLDCGHLTILPYEASVVKKIFSFAIDGLGSPAIAKWLNDSHIPTKRGGTWQPGTVLHMISNELYMGDLRLQKTWRDPDYRIHTNHGELPQYYISDHHDSIVSRETFRRANDAIHDRDTFSHKDPALPDPRQNRYCFTGNLICSLCGSSLVRKYRKRKRVLTPGWICRQHMNDPSACQAVWLSEEQLWKDLTVILYKMGTNQSDILQNYLQRITDKPETGVFFSGHKQGVNVFSDARKNVRITDLKKRNAESDRYMSCVALREFLTCFTFFLRENGHSFIETNFEKQFHYIIVDSHSLSCMFQCGLQVNYDRETGGIYGN